MKRNLTITAAPVAERDELLSRLTNFMERRRWVLELSKLYGWLLERPVSPRRVLAITQAQCALSALLLFGGQSFSTFLLLLWWTVWAVRRTGLFGH